MIPVNHLAESRKLVETLVNRNFADPESRTNIAGGGRGFSQFHPLITGTIETSRYIRLRYGQSPAYRRTSKS